MSAVYLSGKQGLQGGDIDLINDDISAVLVDLSVYTPSPGVDVSLADIPADALIAEALLTGKSLDAVEDGGVFYSAFRADDTVFNSVALSETAPEVSGVVLFKKAATYSGSILIFLEDEAPEYPITPDGTDITVQWSAGDNGIFRF
jgi:hypothetical protein